MATPDYLVLLETDAGDASTRDDQHDNKPAPDHLTSECAGPNPVQCQEGIVEIRAPNIQEDRGTKSASDLIHLSVHNARLEVTRINPDNDDISHDLLHQTSQSFREANTFLHSHLPALSEQHKFAEHDVTLNISASYQMSNDIEHPLVNTALDIMNTPVNISTVLTHASSVLDPLEMLNNVSETADGPDNNNSAILTLNKTSEDKLVYPTVDSRTSFAMNVKPGECSNDQPVDESNTVSLMTEIAPKDESEGVSLKFTGIKRDGEVCNETWLDACQFLAGEENGGAIFDKCRRSLSSSPPEAEPDYTKASCVLNRDNISIDQQAENWDLFPSVERWSSTDSWASALSDWFQTVSTYTEDSFTGTNTLSADSKLGMAIQDTAVEQRTSPDITNLGGQTCMSLKPANDEALEKEVVKKGNDDSFRSNSDRQTNVIVEDEVNLPQPLIESVSHVPEMKTVLDALNVEMTPRSPENEFDVKQCGSQHISGELWSAKSEGDALVSHLGLDIESGSVAQRISANTSDKNLTAGCVSGEARHRSDADFHTCSSHSNDHVSFLKHTQGVETDEKSISCSFIEGSNIVDFTVKPKERRDTVTEFIMPFDPLGTGNNFLHHGVFKEDIAHVGVDVPIQGIFNDEICHKPSIKNSRNSNDSHDSSKGRFPDHSSSCEDSDGIKDSKRNQCDIITKELSNFILLTGEHFMVSKTNHIAYVSLDLHEPGDLNHVFFSNHVNSQRQNCSAAQVKKDKMPHKTSSDGKGRSKHKEISADQQHGIHTSKHQEKPPSQEKSQVNSEEAGCGGREVTEVVVRAEKITPKTQGKKKKKHAHNGTAKHETDPPAEVRNRTVQKNANSKVENIEAKVASNGLASHLSTKVDTANKNSTQKPMSVRPKVGPNCTIVAKMDTDTSQKTIPVKAKAETSGNTVAKIDMSNTDMSQKTILVKHIKDKSQNNVTKMDTSNTDTSQKTILVKPIEDKSRNNVAKMDTSKMDTSQKTMPVKPIEDKSRSNVAKMDTSNTGTSQKTIPYKPKAEPSGNKMAKMDTSNTDMTQKSILVKHIEDKSLNNVTKMDTSKMDTSQKTMPVKPIEDKSQNNVAKVVQLNKDTSEKTIPIKSIVDISATNVAKLDPIQKAIPVKSLRDKSGTTVAKKGTSNMDTNQKTIPVKSKADTSGNNVAKLENKTCSSEPQSTCLSGTINDDIKRRRIANDQSGTILMKIRPQLPAIFRQARKDEDVTRRPYSEVAKQKTPTPKEVVVPHVQSEIQVDPVPAEPQNISLWCRFNQVPPDATIKWTKEGTVLTENKKGEGDDERFTLTILKACSKDLGLYKCTLSTSNISVSTSEYHLTSEVLMELVIPSHDQPAEPRIVQGDEENIQCSPLLFKEDFLSDQYFGENQPASIVTEKLHFGEGMHRKAFRTTLRASKLPRFNPGHPCVLKVHNSIGYGTKSNDELVQRNYSLAVEECHVQNTAREYIKAYHSVAKSAESFGEVPEIIPIYLVHRPSNEIPYATLEEELLGDFVKYSVKDGKEINLIRKDSEAGQKCCAFQHWVYTQTEGNLLVTDMQGVGMKLTDVGIATCKKGYKGFRGNCATSFIDQFKALHQCNKYCELLGLKSLQPKPKQTVQPKPKAQPGPKKNPFGSVLKGKS
ncbi:alpha-protein kinase 2 [Paramisgurnus dabryanus]|uniref:alpha-protein kinase 2 n=1 Tax=Paramisgurnus dabryanus TaxID=90735 RepID=UPI003CCEFFAD